MKHTPGEWGILNHTDIWSRYGHNSQFLATINSKTYSVEGYHENQFPNEKEAEANARLIASTPKLLEALQTIADIERSDGLYDHYDAKGAIKIAKQAISEAVEGV